VEDPVAPSNNVGRNCFRIRQIQRVFGAAHRALTAAGVGVEGVGGAGDVLSTPLLTAILRHADGGRAELAESALAYQQHWALSYKQHSAQCDDDAGPRTDAMGRGQPQHQWDSMGTGRQRLHYPPQPHRHQLQHHQMAQGTPPPAARRPSSGARMRGPGSGNSGGAGVGGGSGGADGRRKRSFGSPHHMPLQSWMPRATDDIEFGRPPTRRSQSISFGQGGHQA